MGDEERTQRSLQQRVEGGTLSANSADCTHPHGNKYEIGPHSPPQRSGSASEDITQLSVELRFSEAQNCTAYNYDVKLSLALGQNCVHSDPNPNPNPKPNPNPIPNQTETQSRVPRAKPISNLCFIAVELELRGAPPPVSRRPPRPTYEWRGLRPEHHAPAWCPQSAGATAHARREQ